MNKEKVEHAAKILDEYFAGALPADLEAKIRYWLLDEKNRGEKDTALKSLWNERIYKDTDPGQYARESLENLCERLGFPAETPNRSVTKTRPLHRRLMFRIAAVAIPVLLVVGIAGIWLSREKDPVWLTLSAGERTQEYHLLPDGSEVWINPDSEVAYREDFPKNREIRLDGEAFFRVMPDEGKPFTVSTEDLTVTVHGTEFMVTAIESKDRTTVTLHSGSVDVAAGEAVQTLEPGEQLQYYPGDNEIRVEEVELEDWTKPSLNFYAASLEEIFYSLEVNFNVQFTVSQLLPENPKYTIRFSADQDIGQIVRILSALTRSFTYSFNDQTFDITIK